MSNLARVLKRVFTLLIHLYPRRFRDEFDVEMVSVFDEHISKAMENGWRACLRVFMRELFDLPIVICSLIWESTRKFDLPSLMKHFLERLMENQTLEPNKPIPKKEIAAGILPFMIFGITLTLNEIPHYWEIPGLKLVVGLLFFAVLLLPLVGFGVGWVQGFPRWSYAYTGMAIVMSAYLVDAATPGIKLFGYLLFGGELWGWRAWIPLITAGGIALLISRSLRPAVRFFIHIWEDWSLITYTLFGFMPLLIAFGFDDIDRLFSLPFMVAFTIIMVAASGLYLRGESLRGGVVPLLVGVLLIITITVTASTLYWLENGWVNVSRQVDRATPVLVVFLAPALLETFRRRVQRMRTA